METLGKTVIGWLMRLPLLRSLLIVAVGIPMALLAVFFWNEELGYSLDGRPATAVVEKFQWGKSWTGQGHVSFDREGQPVKALVQTIGYSLSPGGELAILYRPDVPGQVRPDHWSRFVTAMITTLAAAVLLYFAGSSIFQDVRWLSTSGRPDRGALKAVTPGADTGDPVPS